MKIFSTDGIRRIEEATVEAEGLKMLDLMERAASAVAYEIISRWRPSKRIVVFAGPGNNGGDALAVSRLLAEQGYRTEVYLFNIRRSQLSPCCLTNRDRIVGLDKVDLIEVIDTFTPPELGPDDLVIDGLFGSGLRDPLKGGYASTVQYINESNAFVVSIDTPSGLFGEWNSGVDRRNIIRANLTLAFQFRRLSFFFSENAEYVGEVKVLDLEMSEEAISHTPTDFYLIEREDVKGMLKTKNPFINKYDNGTVFLVAGSYGMMGAAILAARGATRAGAGLVTVHAPRCGMLPVATGVPEVLFEADSNEYFTSEINLNHKYSVVAMGPGMSMSDETVDAVDSFLKRCRQPIVLDADALNCIAMRQVLLRSIPKGSIITPHNAEFDRLFGMHDTDEERLKKAIDVSRLYEITIVLKGRYSMTVLPDGKVYINSSGNPGMATAGSGDTLTGIIAAFIAQKYPSAWAVVLGVYIHGLAGDIAMEEQGAYGVIAPDIANNVGKAIHSLQRRPEE